MPDATTPDAPSPDNRFDMEPPADTDVLNSTEEETSLADLALEKLEPVGAAMSVVKSFVDFSNRFATLPSDRKATLAGYFEGLGRSLGEISTTLRAGGSPDQACAAVQQHARELTKTFAGILTLEESQVLTGRLRSLRTSDRFQEELDRAAFESPAGRDYELDRLDKVVHLTSELVRSLRTG